jgi:DNA-directed RNA polymerase subunit K/omega
VTPKATRSMHWNAYEFVVVSSWRAHQLMRGCTPRLGGDHKATTMARMEVAAGKIARVPDREISGS